MYKGRRGRRPSVPAPNDVVQTTPIESAEGAPSTVPDDDQASIPLHMSTASTQKRQAKLR